MKRNSNGTSLEWEVNQKLQNVQGLMIKWVGFLSSRFICRIQYVIQKNLDLLEVRPSQNLWDPVATLVWTFLDFTQPNPSSESIALWSWWWRKRDYWVIFSQEVNFYLEFNTNSASASLLCEFGSQCNSSLAWEFVSKN